MIRKFVLPFLAIVGFVAALMAAREGGQPVQSQNPVVTPAANPYGSSVSGAGITEAQSENIAVAPAIGGIVTDVFVKWGQRVEVGTKLFEVDDRPIKAQIAAQEADVTARQAAVAQAQANLEKLKAGARPEDVPIYEARVQAAEATLADNQDQYDRVVKLVPSGAVSSDDLNRRRFAVLESGATVAEAKADLAKLMAGTWDRDIAVQEAAVAAAKADAAASTAKLETLKVDLDRSTVRAPVAGEVLRINVRRGEFIAAAGVGSASDGAVVIGDVEHLNVRVDIDENDVPRFHSANGAIGFIRGKTDQPIPLHFVRVEPFVIPKKNLTGSNIERVDTRVLQVIYTFDKKDLPLYVGQQMDVFIDAGTAK
jgi:multidrug resistance efflux pump